VIADSAGRAIAFALVPGQAHELPHAVPLLACLSDVPMWVVADRGYSSHAFREHVWDLGARPAIPTRRDEAPLACPALLYNNRNRVERLWARLNEWRAVATRYEKAARVLCLLPGWARIQLAPWRFVIRRSGSSYRPWIGGAASARRSMTDNR